MNIVYFISTLKIGGAEKQNVLDANLLANEHNVFFVSFEKGPLLDLLSSNVTYIQLDKSNYIRSAFLLSKICKEHKIQIIHASLFAAFIISAFSTIFRKTSVIWHFHSHEYDWPLKSKIAVKLFSRFSGVKKILFVNKELIEYFTFLKFPKNKIGLLYNHSTVNSNATITKNTNTIIRIGFIGRIVPLKRVEYLIELAQYLIKHNLSYFIIDIVGNGDSLATIEKQIDSIKLKQHFNLHGFQTDVNKFYKTFDFFVNPSREECLSIAMIDAGMHSLPIIAFNVGGNEEIVKDGLNGYIVSDKKAFFNSCKDLLVNEELRTKMGMQSKIHCSKHFSESVHKEELITIYNKVLQC
jgi:glycosyltransferase involved in cell wall biosynthesis